MRLRIISGIDNIQFCDSNIFGWFFQNFKIETTTINVQNTSVETFETAYYINIKSIKDFSKLINKASKAVAKRLCRILSSIITKN